MFKFIITFVVFAAIDAKFPPVKDKIATKAILDVTFELFVRHKIDFDLIVLGRSSTRTNGIVTGILERQKQPRKVHRVDSLNKWSGKSALVLAESFSVLTRALAGNENVQPDLLVYVVLKREEIFGYELLSISALNNYFLVESKSKLELTVQGKDCNAREFSLLNTFDKQSGKWQNRMEIPGKFLNFHNCSLRLFS